MRVIRDKIKFENNFSFFIFYLVQNIWRVLLFFLASFASGLALGGEHNLTLEHGNLHDLRQLTELLAELLDLVGVYEDGRAVSEVEGVVPRPEVHGVLLLGATGRHHQLTIAVHLRVLVELRVYVLLPARHHRPTIAHSTNLLN